MALDRSDDSLLTPFVWGKGGKRKTQDEIDADKKLALLLMKSGSDYSPVQHWTQGGARVMQALAGVVRENRANSAALQNANLSAQNIANMLGANQPQGPSVVPNTPAVTPPQSPATVKPTEPFQPQVQAQPSPFVKPEGSITPEQPFVPTADPVTPQKNTNAALNLDPQSVNQIKKVLLTEVIAGLPKDAYNAQAAGIVDTIMNRVMSGRWGNNVKSVVNAPYQFSDINGPVSWKRHGRNDVDQITDAWLQSPAGKKASEFVDRYLALRSGNAAEAPNVPMAEGAPHYAQLVGGHLNYANPHYSDKSNLPWIMALDGPVLGQGTAIHRHGTAGNQKPVDASYPVNLTGQPQMAEAPPQEMVQRPVQVASLDGVNPQDVLQARPDVASANVNPQEVMQPAQEQVAQAPFSMNDAMAANSMMPPLAQQQQPIMPPQQAPAAPPPPPAAPQAPQRPQIDPRIIQAVTSPYSSPAERQIAMKLLEPHITPDQQQFTTLPNGMVLRKSARTGRAEVFNPYTQQVITDPNQIPQGLRNTQFGLNPIYTQDANGNIIPVQLGNDGTAKPVQLPDNLKVSPKGIKVDLGTHEVFVNPHNMQPLGPPIPKNIAEVEKQKKIGQGEGQNIVNQPKEDARRYQAQQAAKLVIEDIDRAIKLVETSTLPTTGFFGNVLKGVGNTGAHDVSKLVDTIKSNAGFDKLQAMREASPTGGALGQVAVQELVMLQSAIGSLEQSQSQEQFIANLKRVRKLYDDIIHRGIPGVTQQNTPPAAEDPLGIR